MLSERERLALRIGTAILDLLDYAVAALPARGAHVVVPAPSAPPPEPSFDTKPFLTRNELAERWGLSVEKIDLMIRDEPLKVLKAGRAVRVPMKEVLRFERSATR